MRILLLMLLAACSLDNAGATPLAPSPPSYDCKPGTANDKTQRCECPAGYSSETHSNGVPYCRPRKVGSGAGSGGDAMPTQPPITCGDFAPIVHVVCSPGCGQEDRKSEPQPWDGQRVWKPLTSNGVGSSLQCQKGPSANASEQAQCSTSPTGISLSVSAKATRDGGCIHCEGSGGYAAFEWRTSIRNQKGSRALRAIGQQSVGNTAPNRCLLSFGTEKVSWSKLSQGIVRNLPNGAVDVGLTCTDSNGAFVGAGMMGGMNCRYVSEEGAITLTLEALGSPCGQVGQACCAGTPDRCESGSLCSNNTCEQCGSLGQVCCANNTCAGTAACIDSQCHAYTLGHSGSAIHAGGGSGGTESYNFPCGDGQVGVGLQGKSGDVVDRLGLICAPVKSDGTIGSPQNTGSSGGNDAKPFSISCPPGQILTGLFGKSGEVVNSLSGHCASPETILGRAKHSSSIDKVGGEGGNTFDRSCPPREVLTGISGKTGGRVNKVDVTCTRLLYQ